MRALLAALVLTAPAAAPSTQSLEFKSVREAAIAALQHAADLSPYYEYAGVILRTDDGTYVVDEPNTLYSGDSSSWDADPADYDGTIVASYHTHPCNQISHIPGMFSETDLKSARMTDKESFMADLCTGAVHAWTPGVDTDPYIEQTRLMQLLKPEHTPGRIVGHIKVTGAPLEY